MGRTLLVGHSATTWRDAIKELSGALVCLDPADADHGPPCRAFVLSEGKVRAWRLIGSTDPGRNPIGLVAAAWALVGQANDDATVQLFNVRDTPLSRQLALALARAIGPERVLVPMGSGLASLGWPVGAEEVELPEAFPYVVHEAQRRARWLEVLEKSESHDVDLTTVSIDGSRLGSGHRIDVPDWQGWAEVTGTVVHMVGDRAVADEEAGKILDLAHASRLSVQSPEAYRGLVCSFADQEGEDFGIGVVQSFDPVRGQMRVKCTAVAPAPVRILRLGALQVDSSGREAGDVRPYEL